MSWGCGEVKKKKSVLRSVRSREAPVFLMSGVWIKGWCAQVPRTVLPCVSAVLVQMKLDYSVCPIIDPSHNQIIDAKVWQGEEIRSLDLAWNAGCLLRMGTRVVSDILNLG